MALKLNMAATIGSYTAPDRKCYYRPFDGGLFEVSSRRICSVHYIPCRDYNGSRFQSQLVQLKTVRKFMMLYSFSVDTLPLNAHDTNAAGKSMKYGFLSLFANYNCVKS